MSNVITFPRATEYVAVPFAVDIPNIGVFRASGTLCGNLDFVVPGFGTLVLSAVEALEIASMLRSACDDVVKNSAPYHDARIYDGDVK